MCTVWCIDVLVILSSSIILVGLAQPKIILCCWCRLQWVMEHGPSIYSSYCTLIETSYILSQN